MLFIKWRYDPRTSYNISFNALYLGHKIREAKHAIKELFTSSKSSCFGLYCLAHGNSSIGPVFNVIEAVLYKAFWMVSMNFVTSI